MPHKAMQATDAPSGSTHKKSPVECFLIKLYGVKHKSTQSRLAEICYAFPEKAQFSRFLPKKKSATVPGPV